MLPAFAVLSSNQRIQRKIGKTPVWWIVGAFFIALIGLRHQVGGDWGNYAEQLVDVLGISLGAALERGDPGYAFLNWLSGIMGWGLYGVNTICALLFTAGLLFFCLNQPNPWLALTVSVPYLVVVVAMGYTRQSVAIGLSMFALVALSYEQIFRFSIWIFFAALFHKSAVVLLVLGLLLSSGGWWWRIPLMTGVIFFSYSALFQNDVQNWQTNYIEAGYSSSGAAIRIAMNALPAFIFLTFIKRFGLNQRVQKVWWLLAWAALLAVPVLIISPSSTAVDRISLYLIPIQIFVWSRLPGLKLIGNNQTGKLAVLFYSAAVLFVWLVFAENSRSWVPYTFAPFLWLSEV